MSSLIINEPDSLNRRLREIDLRGEEGPSGLVGPIGQTGPMGEIGTVDYSSYEFEEAVLKVLSKYGVVQDATVGSYDPTVGYVNDYANGCVANPDTNLSPNKTFTIDEVITIINSIPVELNVNHGGVFEFTKKELIDKNKLKDTFKSL